MDKSIFFKKEIEEILINENEINLPDNIFCVYLTIYTGGIKELPFYYIGSTSIKKIIDGYNGSVKSKMWESIFTMLKVDNMLRTEIICTTKIRKQALDIEFKIQQKLNVVRNDNFYNMSFASVNGYFGMDVSGSNNSQFGTHRIAWNKGKSGYKIHTKESKKRISGLGRKQPVSQKKKIGIINSKIYTDGVNIWFGRDEIRKHFDYKSLFNIKKMIRNNEIYTM